MIMPEASLIKAVEMRRNAILPGLSFCAISMKT